MTIETRALSPVLGVEILDFDPRRPIDEATRDAILDAYDRHHVILVRGSELSEDDQLRFARLFGVASSRGGKGYARPDRTLSYVSNVHEDGVFRDGELSFHSDLTFLEHPLKARCLHALTLPSEGGETLFSNVMLAYETLPSDLKKKISVLKARHAIKYVKDGVEYVDEFVRPMVEPHPVNGRPVLMVSRAVTKEIIGMERPEFRQLLKELWAHIEKPAFVYRHTWKLYDFILWDNIALQHARTAFDPAQKRTLRAVSIDPEPLDGQPAQ